MRKVVTGVVAALLIGCWLVTGTASSAHRTACTITLRVNVFGPSTPQSSWALQGGLNTGKPAFLRARSRGCNLASITGRGVSPSSYRHHFMCGGHSCQVHVTRNTQQAIDFEAFGPGRPGARAHSNIVRVAWAGGHINTWSGTWNRPGVGQFDLAQNGTEITGTWHWGTGGGLQGHLRRDGIVVGTWNGGNYAVKSGTIDWGPLSADGKSFTGTGSYGSETRSWDGNCVAGPCLNNHT